MKEETIVGYAKKNCLIALYNFFLGRCLRTIFSTQSQTSTEVQPLNLPKEGVVSLFPPPYFYASFKLVF